VLYIEIVYVNLDKSLKHVHVIWFFTCRVFNVQDVGTYGYRTLL